MAIVSRLGGIMAARGVTDAELAEDAGVDPSAVSRLREGRFRAVRLSTLDRLCEALSCEPGDLLARVPEDR